MDKTVWINILNQEDNSKFTYRYLTKIKFPTIESNLIITKSLSFCLNSKK